MLIVDERVGSKDLLTPLIRYGVPAELGQLQFGDFAFVGKGLNDADVLIGIELKETQDLISSLRSARFAGHQLPGLQQMYDRVWLVTEGIWRTGDEGVLEIMSGGWRPVSTQSRRVMTGDLEAWILTQSILGGVSYWHCPTRRDTIRFISVLYHWWTDQCIDKHRSHQVIYHPPPDRVMLTEPSVFMKMVSCIPKVGWDKAAALEDHCQGSLKVLQGLSEKDLQAIPGIGKIIATNIRKTFT